MEKTEIKKSVVDILYGLVPSSHENKEILEYVDLVDDLGMDSLSFISVVIEVESKFGVTVPDEMLQMDYFRNTSLIVELVDNIIDSNGMDNKEQENTHDKA